MKASKSIVIGIMFLLAGSMQAQFSMSINLPTPPMWGLAGPNTVRYYYLPDVEAYYDMKTSMFIYFSGSSWVHRTALPSRYRNYDLYGGYKVVMPNYHGNAPYSHFKEHKMKYRKGHYHGKPQRTIGNRTGRPNPNAQGYHVKPRGNQDGDHNNKGKSENNRNGKNGNHGHDQGGGNGKKR
jgi:hypothetical protein